MFRPWKQSNSMECLACVAAMATRTTPNDFVDFLKREFPGEEIKPPYHDKYFQRYLLEFNMIVGVGLGHIDYVKNSDNEYLGFAAYPLHRSAALISVRLDNEAIEHALFWDGKKIWDPDPNTEDGRDPLSYNIAGWWPITCLNFPNRTAHKLNS